MRAGQIWYVSGAARQGGTCECDQEMRREGSLMVTVTCTRDLVLEEGAGDKCWRKNLDRVDLLERLIQGSGWTVMESEPSLQTSF